MVRYLFFVTLIVVLYSCGSRYNEFDAELVAKNYCNCLKEQNAQTDFFSARAICDGMLLQSNKYYRVSYIEANYGRYMMFFSTGFRDSVADFHTRFSNYVEKSCCKVAIVNCNDQDSLQLKRKAIDSLYKN